jgi:hypothetical protein
MILDSKWIFSDAQAMPNATEVICTNIISWQTAINKDWINTPIPLWIVFTCNTVPGGGTSVQIEFYQHSTTTITSGDLLWAGPIITVANLSASPDNDGHWLAVVPLITLMTAAQAMTTQDQYFGPVIKGAGDVSTGKVDGWLHMGVNPPIPVTRPTASNIVMPA